MGASLTPQEGAVLSLHEAGKTGAEIGAALDISVRTVHSHLASARRKSGGHIGKSRCLCCSKWHPPAEFRGVDGKWRRTCRSCRTRKTRQRQAAEAARVEREIAAEAVAVQEWPAVWWALGRPEANVVEEVAS